MNDSTPAAEPQATRLDLMGSGLTSRHSGQAVNEHPAADVSEEQARAWMRADEERAQRRYEAARDSALPMGFPPC